MVNRCARSIAYDARQREIAKPYSAYIYISPFQTEKPKNRKLTALSYIYDGATPRTNEKQQLIALSYIYHGSTPRTTKNQITFYHTVIVM